MKSVTASSSHAYGPTDTPASLGEDIAGIL